MALWIEFKPSKWEEMLTTFACTYSPCALQVYVFLDYSQVFCYSNSKWAYDIV